MSPTKDLVLVVGYGQSYSSIDSNLYKYNIYRLNLTTFVWTKLPQYGQKPTTRYSAASAYYQNAFYIYSGEDIEKDLNLYRYDLLTNVWLMLPVVGDKPGYRAFASMIIEYPYLHLLNGWIPSKSVTVDDCFTIDLSSSTLQWQPLKFQGLQDSLPVSTTICEADGSYYLIGGWELSGITNSCIQLTPLDKGAQLRATMIIDSYETPEPRRLFSARYTAGKVFIFGGISNTGT